MGLRVTKIESIRDEQIGPPGRHDWRRMATCRCRGCRLVFKMQLVYVWECRDNGGPFCPNGCNGDADHADGSTTVEVSV